MVGLSPEGIEPSKATDSVSDVSDDDIEEQKRMMNETEVPPPPADDSNNIGVSTGNTQGANLPPNWSTAVSPQDGRVYYWNSVTGETSWTHPNFTGTLPPPPPNDEIRTSLTAVPSMGDASGIMETRSNGTFVDPFVGSSGVGDFHAMVDKQHEIGDFHDYDPSKPIDSHRFYSIFAFILFFPLGIFALIQSCAVVSKWKQAKYADAHDKSQQALLYSRISCSIGICFWIYYLFFSGPGPFVIDWHWPAFAW